MTFQRISTALAAALAFLTVSAACAHPVRSAGIAVDVGPLRSNSGEPTASWAAEDLTAALAAAGVSGVSVRIDYVILGPNSAVGIAGYVPDQMLGQVTRGGATHDLRATSAYSPSGADSAMIEQANRMRVANLARAFADWVAKGY